MSFILVRLGKNAIGPFVNLSDAATHMVENNLLGYAVMPLVPGPRTEPWSDKGAHPIDKNVALWDRLEAWYPMVSVDDGLSDRARVDIFIGAALHRFPELSGMKINMIKLVRYWSADNVPAGSLGLKEAKDAVDAHYAKNGIIR